MVLTSLSLPTANVAHKIKEAGQDVTQGKATGKAKEIRDEVTEEGKAKADEAKGKAKDTVEDAKRKL